MKTCIKCSNIKPKQEFSKDKSRTDGFSNTCKLCRRSYEHDYNKKNVLKIKDRDLKRNHGITLEDKLKMISNQNNMCLICKTHFSSSERAKFPCVDHNHKTNKIRSILCDRCNRVLGEIEENVSILESMILYLK